MSTRWNHDDTLPPQKNREVAEIMAELGCGRRQAYKIARERHQKAVVPLGDVPQGQRMAVMSALTSEPGSGKDAMVLLDKLHAGGVKIDMHDTVKTLWALQKMRWVTFREAHGGRTLCAIKVTQEGSTGWNALTGRTPEPEAAITPLDIAVMNDDEEEENVMIPIAIEAPSHMSLEDVLERCPTIKALLSRRDKIEKIEEAAKLLSEAGEEDTALALLSKTEMSAIESEVLTLIDTLS